MNSISKGPHYSEIETRLVAAFAPTRLVVTNESAQHSGHSGDDGSGESHFAIEIESVAFTGLSRIDRQRAVNRALGDLPGTRVHSVRIKASATGEG